MNPYIELHAASAFSFLDGASLPEELAHVGAELGMPGMALLDRDGVYGSPQFYKAATKAGMQPHVGAELTSASGGCYPLLAETQRGYQNLCRLTTRMKLRAAKGGGSIEAHELEEFAEGLICMTGGAHGPLTEAIRRGGLPEGRKILRQLIDIFGHGDVYVELQRHFERDEEAVNQRAVDLAREFQLPILATNGVRHATRKGREILDVFTCLRHYRTLETAGRLLTRNAERHLKSPQEMATLFRDLPEAIGNTSELSSRLVFTMANPGYEFPAYPVPDGETMSSFLRTLAEAGAHRRFHPYGEKERKQIERELRLIEKLKLEGYFLIVWDIIQFCLANNILVQGRGSAANSAVCYVLGITAVDPIKSRLLFERFLSEERGEWPDIDLDLPSGSKRERTIQYVYERYGRLGAAMTANVITYRGKSAAREVGKVLGFDFDLLARLTKLVSSWGYQDSEDTLAANFRDAGFDVRHPRIGKFLSLCMGLQELPRHLGQHSGGMVICQGRLDSVVPLEPASMPNRNVVQWDKDSCADMKIIKVDLLGLGMMAVLEDSIQLIHDHYNEDVDLAHLPEDDPTVYSALQQADTVGMFQIESRAQMSFLPRMKPKTFYDIVVQVAIIRPGPITGDMVHPYLKRRQKREKVEYAHPALQPVLERTLGVPLFQEQLLSMAIIAAGFTGGEGEELRRAFGFKRSEKRMKEIEVKLRDGMTRNGIEGSAQDQIVRSITAFALYGFPESHAISFALIAYASAYLKCHYLPAFTAAMLNNQPMGFYNPATLVKDAQRHGLRIRPIDVTASDWRCTLDHLTVRLGLCYAHGLRKAAGEALVRERARAPFASVEDLARRVPELQKSELVLLAEIGALNFLNPENRMHRRDALWQVERAARPSGPLLETTPENTEDADDASPLRIMTTQERIVADLNRTGLTVGPHPMYYCRDRMNELGVKRAADLAHIRNGEMVRIAGCVIARQRPSTAKGFVFLSLEDETGIANAILMPDIFQSYRQTIIDGRFLLLDGLLQNVDHVVSVKVSAARMIDVTEAITVSHDFH